MNELDGEPDVPAPGTDAITDRLRRLAAHEIPRATRHAQVQAMHAASPPSVVPADRREKRFGRLAVALTAVVSFMAGSTGLALAGALPGPAQDAASDVLSVVGLDVPSGKEGKRGPCVSEASKLADPAAQEAAKDACPKGPFGKGRDGAPGQTGEKPPDPGQSGNPPGQADKTDDPCRGKPPWAGNHDLTDEEVAAAKAERSACPDDTEDLDTETESESGD